MKGIGVERLLLHSSLCTNIRDTSLVMNTFFYYFDWTALFAWNFQQRVFFFMLLPEWLQKKGKEKLEVLCKRGRGKDKKDKNDK